MSFMFINATSFNQCCN